MIGQHLGLAASSLYAKGRDEGSSFTLKRLVSIVASGETAPVKWLAAAAPGLYVAELPPGDLMETLPLGLSRAVKEFSEFLSEAAESLRDGRLSGESLSRLKKEGMEAVSIILGFVELSQQLEQRSAGSAARAEIKVGAPDV